MGDQKIKREWQLCKLRILERLAHQYGRWHHWRRFADAHLGHFWLE